jgi:hypothetical protein
MAQRKGAATETFSAADLRDCPDAIFDAVERGDIALIRRNGRLYRIGRHRPLVAVPSAPRPASPILARGWKWRLDSSGVLRLVRPVSENRERSSN